MTRILASALLALQHCRIFAPLVRGLHQLRADFVAIQQACLSPKQFDGATLGNENVCTLIDLAVGGRAALNLKIGYATIYEDASPSRKREGCKLYPMNNFKAARPRGEAGRAAPGWGVSSSRVL